MTWRDATGRPKGAINTHDAVACNSAAKRSWLGLVTDDVVLAIAPLFHITGLIAHMTMTIVTGSPLALGFRFEPGVMLSLIEEYRPTFTVGAITVFIALMDYPERPARDLSSLTKVYSGGAPVSPAVVARFEREVGPSIHNIYGLTEATAATHAVPVGEPGELVIRGPQIASGYWGRAEETAEAFTPAGFRTGDIGIMDAYGWFYPIDRSKDVIIASG